MNYKVVFVLLMLSFASCQTTIKDRGLPVAQIYQETAEIRGGIYKSTTNRFYRAFADAKVDALRCADQDSDGFVTREELKIMDESERTIEYVEERNIHVPWTDRQATSEMFREAKVLFDYHFYKVIKSRNSFSQVHSQYVTSPEPNYMMKGMLEEVGRKIITP